MPLVNDQNRVKSMLATVKSHQRQNHKLEKERVIIGWKKERVNLQLHYKGGTRTPISHAYMSTKKTICTKWN